MSTVDFKGRLTPSGQIDVPPEIASQVPKGVAVQGRARVGTEGR